MGVLGEYLGRVYDEVRGRPLSIINKVYYAAQLSPAQVGLGRQDGDRERVFRIA
jgi:dolichol-phosphate mannosyltransferase